MILHITFDRFTKGYNLETIPFRKIEGYAINSKDAVLINSDRILIDDGFGRFSYKLKDEEISNKVSEGYYLLRAGNLGLKSFGVSILTAVAIFAIKDNDTKLVVGVAGGLISTIMVVSAWNNIKLAGKAMNSKNTSLSIAPSSIQLVCRF